MNKNKPLARILLIIVTCVWGSTFSEVQNTISQSIVYNDDQSISALTPNSYIFFRFLIASILAFLLVAKNSITFTRDEVIGGIYCGILIYLGYYCQKQGLIDTTSGSAAFMTSTSVIIVPILLWIFRINKIVFNVWIGVAVAFFGLLMITKAELNVGDLYAFFCAVSFAIHIIFQGIYNKKGVRVFHFFFIQAILCVILSVIFSLNGDSVIPYFIEYKQFSYPLIRSLFITAVLASFFAFVIMIWAQKILDPVQTVMIFSLEPVFTFLYDQLFQDKSYELFQWLGGIMVVLAILISENKKINQTMYNFLMSFKKTSH
tara:strand:+ start:464 stop:1414 length:951 start_codon:yes stop_codon:yes gene_type:complete